MNPPREDRLQIRSAMRRRWRVEGESVEADPSSEKEGGRLSDDGLVAPRTSVAAAGPGMRELP